MRLESLPQVSYKEPFSGLVNIKNALILLKILLLENIVRWQNLNHLP